jgi:hypothetical protein
LVRIKDIEREEIESTSRPTLLPDGILGEDDNASDDKESVVDVMVDELFFVF